MAAAIKNCALVVSLMVCTTLFLCVEGDYRLEVQFLRLGNLTGRCGDPRCAVNQGCCESPPPSQHGLPPCAGLCGYHPRFCVRPLSTTSNSSSDCLQQITLTNHAVNAASGGFLTFVTGNADFFGTVNPAVITGPRWPGGIQLFMEVYDLDNGHDVELVDRFTVDVNVSVGSNITTNTTGVFGLVELQVNFRVMCVEDFFVLDCATCSGVNRDPSTNCSTCLAGYGGSDCSVDLDRCGHTTPCENGATCNNTGPDQYECLCAAGFEGVDCTIDLDRCGHTTPCENGATCNNTGPDQYECLCAAGFEGVNCETRETDECDPNPCMNGGTCTDLLADYNCSCLPGFSGTNCDQEEGATSDGGTGGVVAGAVGGVVGGLLLIIIILVVVVIVMATISSRRKVLGTHTTSGKVAMNNPTYAGDIGSHAPPPEKTNTGSSPEHDFDNPLYNTKDLESSWNDYSKPWGTKSHGPTSKVPPETTAKFPNEYDYTVSKGTAAVYDSADDPATQTKVLQPMYDYADQSKPLSSKGKDRQPVYDDATTPPGKRTIEQQPMYDCADSVAPLGTMSSTEPKHTYDYADTLGTMSTQEPKHTYDYADTLGTMSTQEPKHTYDYADNAATLSSQGPKHTYDYADPPTAQLTYDYADNQAVHVVTNGRAPVHEYDYAATNQPSYANREAGVLPPGAGEHYEMMPESKVDPTDHYDLGQD